MTNHTHQSIHERSVGFASIVSLVAAALICGIKFAGFYITHSNAILSDALESIVNVLASFLLMLSVRISHEGADEDHHYGHGKIEYFSAGFEGGLIVLAGFFILYESIPMVFKGNVLHKVDIGIVLVVIAGMLNAVLGLFLIREGKKFHSHALIADGQHVMVDVYTTLGVLAGLILVYIFKAPWIDPAIAVIMGFWILWNGYKILSVSFNRLMDKVSPEMIESVVNAMSGNKTPEMILPHRLRIRESGRGLLLDFHLIMPSYLTVNIIHEIEITFQRKLSLTLNRDIDLMIHKDPCIPENCLICPMPACKIRSKDSIGIPDWSAKRLLSDINHPFAD